MMRPIFSFALVGLCLLFHASALAQTTNTLVDKYYHAFNTSDGTARLNASWDFVADVPPASREEVLADLIDLASKNPKDYPVISEAILMLHNYDMVFLQNSHVEKAVLAQVKNPNASVRDLLVGLLAFKYPERYRAISLSFLDDPDDQVRVRTIDAIREWRDVQDILRKYIRDHGADPDRAESANDAKQLLEDLREPISNGNSPSIANAQSLGNGNSTAVASAPTALPSTVATPVQAHQSSQWPWYVGGAMLVAIAILIGRRRRR